MIPFNFHTHTTFSDGIDTPEQMVLAAMQKEFEAIGITDHGFTPFDTTYCMQERNVPVYIKTLRALKKKYAGKIEIYCGIEQDLFSDCDIRPFDYVIGSVHYIKVNGTFYPVDETKDKQLECIEKLFGGDRIAYAKTYYEQVEQMAKQRPTVIGHFDLLTKFGLFDDLGADYEAIAASAMRRVLKTVPIIEVNTGAMARGYRKTPYPAAFLLRTVRQCGGEVMLSSDCHDARQLDYAFDATCTELKNAGFSHVLRFCEHGWEQRTI